MMTEEEYILICLNEECLEVGKAIDKALRFGLTDHDFNNIKHNNRELIIEELNDLAGVLAKMIKMGIFENGEVFNEVKINAKVKKIEHFMKYSRGRGALKPERGMLKWFANCLLSLFCRK